jgi:hypothetical protein
MGIHVRSLDRVYFGSVLERKKLLAESAFYSKVKVKVKVKVKLSLYFN